jgi:hypothetical protein
MGAGSSRANRRRSAPRGSGHLPLDARALLPWIVGTAVVFLVLVAFDQLVLHVPVLTSFDGRAPLLPLYAFWMPEYRTPAVIFIVLALAIAAIVPRLLDQRTSDARFGAGLLTAAVALPVALFLIRENLDRLGSQFLIYPGEEYFDDARRTIDLAGFWRHYAELAPYLSLHGRVHPPGFASLLFLVGRVAGPSPFAAGVAVLLIFAVGILLAWRAFATVVDQRAARIATLLLLATPSLLDFSCTSMDAVFFTAACLALLGAFTALSNGGCRWHAVLTGVAFYLAALFSFSAVPLGLFVLVYGIALWWHRRDRLILLQLCLTLASFMVAYFLFRLATGFDLWESFEVARQQHYQIMDTVLLQRVGAVYVPTTFGNVAALLIGTGLAIVSLFARGAIPALRTSRTMPLVMATTLTLAVMCAGGLLTMETERILMFAMPWLAVSTVGELELSDSAVMLLLGAGWVQAFTMEVLLFTLW